MAKQAVSCEMSLFGCTNLKHGRVETKKEVRGDRWVEVTRCERCGAILREKDAGKYGGTPRPEPSEGWQ